MSAEQIEIKTSGKGTVKAPAEIFGAEVKNHLLHQSVRLLRAKKRSGNHTVLTRSEVRGGGAKPWKQKGTGRARAGSSSSPIWVGGGVAHGPKKKSYEFAVNKKEQKAALRSALSSRQAEGKLIVSNDFSLKEIKTSEAIKALAKTGIDTKQKAVLVVDSADEILTKSLRNIERVRLTNPDSLTAYDILSAPWLVLVGDSLDKIVARLSPKEKTESSQA